jgi:DNA polymerase I-like protein with 3'-5' exonuclease and polymerase domains
MSDFGLASRANIPRQEAQEFINSYFAAYSGISYYMMAIKEQAKNQGFVETLLGRKRQIPELRARTRRCAGPASGWRSTCRSRAPRPTSRRSR